MTPKFNWEFICTQEYRIFETQNRSARYSMLPQ